MANDFALRVGHRFSLDTGRWGMADCEVLEVRPEQMLRYSWRNGSVVTEVTWDLAPEGDGTRLRLVHSGFDLRDPLNRIAYKGMSNGWRSTVWLRFRGELGRAAPG
jgi:uncharacterized protein YndB with AHSA1/START domain